MKLTIPITDVARVLLADGWHDVADQSFDVSDYDFDDGHGNKITNDDRAGFDFVDAAGGWYRGPLSSILAVQVDAPDA